MNESRLKELCREFGIEWGLPPTSQPLEQRETRDLAHELGESPQDLARRMSAADRVVRHDATDELDDAYQATETDVEEEQGEPGTVIETGRVRPAVSKYDSRTVRGTHGRWGVYEEHFRGEPQIYDPITSITEALASATYEVTPPEQIQPSQESEVRAFTDWCNGWLHSIEGGVRRHVAEAGETVLIYGPAVHEIVWGLDEADRKHPVKFGYREPSTYDEWWLDQQRTRLAAVRFEPDDGPAYLLEHGMDLRPDQPTAAPTRKCMHVAWHQRGLNFDGVPPQRPAIQYHKLKALLVQIAGLAADKYGVPVARVMSSEVDLSGDFSPADGTADRSDKADLYKKVKRQRSGKAPVYKIPAGLEVDYMSPGGTMPTLLDLLEYCDQQIAQSFKNEGSLLGQQSAVGSYALGQVSDDKFLRKAPAVADTVLRPINDLIRLLAQAYLETDRPLPAYPTVQMRLGAQIDASQWLADVRKAMGNTPMTEWPTTLQEAALDKLDLPNDALERQEDREITAPESGDTAEEQTR